MKQVNRVPLTYAQLVNFESDEYVCRVARIGQEIHALIEAGFEYICTHEGFMIFRRRK